MEWQSNQFSQRAEWVSESCSYQYSSIWQCEGWPFGNAKHNHSRWGRMAGKVEEISPETTYIIQWGGYSKWHPLLQVIPCQSYGNWFHFSVLCTISLIIKVKHHLTFRTVITTLRNRRGVSKAASNARAPAAAQNHRGRDQKLECKMLVLSRIGGCFWGDEKLIEKWGEQYESERAKPSGMQNTKCPSLVLAFKQSSPIFNS